VGGGYGITSAAELTRQLEATRLTGLLFDPVYTGKAIYGLHEEIKSGRMSEFTDVIFWHTGGGFGVFAHDFSAVL
jgi:D-cysteine desulfhydrase